MRLQIMVLGAAVPAAAGQLWTTGPWDGRDGRPSDRPVPPVRPETRAADDFVLAAGNGRPYAISGASADLLAAHYGSAFAEIYADSGSGEPSGPALATLEQTSQEVLATGVFGVYSHIRVQFGPAGVALPPGRYWLSAVMGVTGSPPPEGYGFFGTAGQGQVQGMEGWDRAGELPWRRSSLAFGYATDYAFTVAGEQAAAACYPNCDGSTGVPVLNVLDFNCFLNRFVLGESYANCDGSTAVPVLNVIDFNCFLNAFVQGCP